MKRSGFASPTSAADYVKLFHCFPNALAISYAFPFYYTQLTSIFLLSFVLQKTISLVFSGITVVISDPCGPRRLQPKKRCPGSGHQIFHPSQGPQEDPVL